MQDQQVEFMEVRNIWHEVDDRETFQYRSDRPLRWLQRLCVWVMTRLGAFRVGYACKVERHRVDGKTFLERLVKQHNSLLRDFALVRPERLLIGAEDYAALMMEDALMQREFSFNSQYRLWEDGRRTIIGLEVTIIPWMKGMLVMPADKPPVRYMDPPEMPKPLEEEIQQIRRGAKL